MNFPTNHAVSWLAAFSLVIGAGACQRAYYGTMERLGYDKRDILVNRVEEARDAQHAAKEQFRSALDEFRAVVKVEPTELEDTYDRLKRELDRSETRARAVHDRIDSLENVGGALFKEWRKELDQYTREDLRRASSRKLENAEDRYEQLIVAMRRAEDRIDPVIGSFRDQVLFLKHNLNAHAVASLETELASVESETQSLIGALERSIADADEFVRDMQEGGSPF